MRRYARRRYSPAQLDAMREGRDSARMAKPAPPRPAPREAGRFLLDVNGQRVELELRPASRDCRQWLAFQDGEPFRGREGAPLGPAGLERIWREVQHRIAPLLGARNL